MAGDEDIVQFLDIAALKQALVEFPEHLPEDRMPALPYAVTIPMAMTAGRYIALCQGPLRYINQ